MVIHVARLNIKWKYKHFRKAVACSTHFLNGGVLLLLFMESHEVYALFEYLNLRCWSSHSSVSFRADNGRIESAVQLKSRMFVSPGFIFKYVLTVFIRGTSAVSADSRQLLVGNLSTGVEVYDTSTFACTALFQMPNHVNVMKHVAYAYRNRLVISGSDCGQVWVWNRDGVVTQKLNHALGACLIRSVTWLTDH